ncbi:MAG: DUF2240 family protein [Methanocellales archaeon]
MSELLLAIAQPFKKRGRNSLTISEFIFALSLDLGWFSPEQAKQVLAMAEKAGLLMKKGEEIKPNFDPKNVEAPFGFKPDIKAILQRSIFDEIIERIMSSGLSKRDAIALVNKKQESLSKLVTIEVAALLVAKERGVEIADLVEKAFIELIKS